MDLDSILDEAEQAAPDAIMVPVCINPAKARERSRLLGALEQAKKDDKLSTAGDARLGAPAPVSDEHEKVAQAALDEWDDSNPGALLRLKFIRMAGQEWAELRLMNPARPNVPLDVEKGYNIDAVSEAAARRTGVLIAGEDQPISEEQWDRLYAVMSGHDVGEIVDAVWTLNEYFPAMQVAALVKGSGAA